MRFPFRSISTLAFKLNDDGNNTLVALLDHPELPKPCFASLQNHLPCLAYASDWVIETIPNASSFAGNHGYSQVPGVLHAQQDDVLIRLNKGGSDSHFDAGYLSLKTGAFGDTTNKSVPFTNWRIWATEKDRDTGRTKPLFIFEHKDSE